MWRNSHQINLTSLDERVIVLSEVRELPRTQIGEKMHKVTFKGQEFKVWQDFAGLDLEPVTENSQELFNLIYDSLESKSLETILAELAVK